MNIAIVDDDPKDQKRLCEYVKNSIAVDTGSSGFPVYGIILILLDVITVAGISVCEVFAVKRAMYGEPQLTLEQKRKRRIIKISIALVIIVAIAGTAIYFVQYYLSKQI